MEMRECSDLKDDEESAPFISPQDKGPSAENDVSELEMDSGAVAWLQCISSFCLSLGTWGLGNSYGKSSL